MVCLWPNLQENESAPIYIINFLRKLPQIKPPLMSLDARFINDVSPEIQMGSKYNIYLI